MKFKFLPLMALTWTCFSTSMLAQEVTVSPLPQSIKWDANKAFDKGFSYTLTGDTDADADAVRVLKSKLPSGSGATVNIVIGERGDAAVASYADKIPTQKEGYYLKVEPNKVIIAGSDTVGTFYGVQTFLQIASQPEVMQVEVTDYPDVVDRGVVEGFYGNPWSKQDRIRQFEFYGANKMNVYIYGPKDDPYHRNQWRTPYPEDKGKEISDLAKAAQENKVQFFWALHPGQDIKWTDEDRQNVINKLESVYNLGVRAFALFFDDISGDGGNGTEQANLMNYITDNFIKKHPELPPLILCPTAYNKAYVGDQNYLTALSTMYPEIRVMWTGNSVVDMIDKSDLDWINPRIGRNAYIWLNYPVNDYCIDRMLMGPTYGNGKDIANQLSGFTSNPMEYAEASKVSLYSIADYSWNLTDYNENDSWERAIKYLMPDHAKAFHVFCENNIDLGSTYHGLRRKDESKRFAEAIEKFNTAIADGLNTAAFDEIKPMFDEFVTSCDELLDSTLAKDPLIAEITPWLQVMKIIGERGQKMCSLYADIVNKNPEEFIKTYKEMVELQTKQKSIRSRDFEGSIKNPNPTVAGEVVSPFLEQYTGQLITEYKKHFTEGWENFPAALLNDGKYYIKYDGKYLTNTNGSTNPTFSSTIDDFNPARQEWIISMDYSTDRYKIVSAQDNRYLNEKGNFTANATTNPYESAWHSYNISRLNGKYAIQNAGEAGDKYWTANDTRINTGTASTYSTSNYIFELVPLEGDTVTYPVILDGGSYYIMDAANNTYLTNNTGNNTPKFETKKDKDPQNTQAWTFTVVPETGRYKIVSVADNRNLNELGQFGTAYDAKWNTFVLKEMGGQFLIQNAGSAGTNYWTITDSAPGKGSKGESESYIFKIVTAPEASMDEEATKVFYKEGLVTDASQIADGDYVVLQNVNTGNLNRQGYIYYNDDTKFLTYLTGYYQTELTDLKSAFPDKYVFQVEKNDEGLSFKNVAGQKYIPNNVSSGAYAPTEDAAHSKFTITASSKVNLAWDIQSTANNTYINGEPGYPVVWSDAHPIKIYKVEDAVQPTEVTANAWFRIQTTDGQSGLRLQLGDTEGVEQLYMANLNNIAAGDEALWSVEESPEVAGRYTLVNKTGEKGSVNWENDMVHEALIDRFGYNTESKDFGIYMKPQTTEVLPSWIMYRINGGSSTLRYINQQGGYVQESKDGSQNGKLWKLVPAVSLQMSSNGYAVGAFSAPVATTIPAGLTAYAATAVTDQDVSLTHLEGSVLPANTPVILVATTAGNYEMAPTTATDGAVSVSTNLLKSTTSGKILAPAGSMVLGNSDEEICMTAATAATPMPAYSVYLDNSGNAVKKTLTFDKLPEQTGIENVLNAENAQDGKIYDLSGRQITHPVKGVYIRNGQKFIVK